MPAKYKLRYFNGKGRAETIRLLMAQGGLQYEDERIDFKDWGGIKPTIPGGCLPVLEVEGVVLTSSTAIGRYVAREAGLMGKTPLDQGRVDGITDLITELREAGVPLLFAKEDKEQKMADFLKKSKEILKNLEQFLAKNKGGSGYFVGDTMTLADLHLVSVIDVISGQVSPEQQLADCPKLKALIQRVQGSPRIATWIKNRPTTTF